MADSWNVYFAVLDTISSYKMMTFNLLVDLQCDVSVNANDGGLTDCQQFIVTLTNKKRLTKYLTDEPKSIGVWGVKEL